jgi:hypothetical protein
VTALELAVADAFAVILIWILLQAIHVYWSAVRGGCVRTCWGHDVGTLGCCLRRDAVHGWVMLLKSLRSNYNLFWLVVAEAILSADSSFNILRVQGVNRASLAWQLCQLATIVVILAVCPHLRWPQRVIGRRMRSLRQTLRLSKALFDLCLLSQSHVTTITCIFSILLRALAQLGWLLSLPAVILARGYLFSLRWWSRVSRFLFLLFLLLQRIQIRANMQSWLGPNLLLLMQRYLVVKLLK